MSSAASLATTHYLGAYHRRANVTIKNVPRLCQTSPEKQNHFWLTDLTQVLSDFVREKAEQEGGHSGPQPRAKETPETPEQGMTLAGLLMDLGQRVPKKSGQSGWGQ